MNRFGQISLTSLFIIFIFAFSTYMIFTPDQEESHVENRALAQAPEMSIKGILKGDYMKDFDSYVTDQFPYRNKWLEAYIHYQRLTNQTYIYEYFITDDDWMLPEPTYDLPTDSLDATAENLNEFGAFLQEQDTELYFFPVPHKESLMQFLLPNHIKAGSYLKNVEYIIDQIDEDNVFTFNFSSDFKSEFTEEEIKQFYFRTDHHWTIEGAFTAYIDIMKKMSEHSSYLEDITVERDNYVSKCANESVVFEGSYNLQIYMTVNPYNENLCTYLPKEDIFQDYIVTVDGDERSPYELYGKGIHDEKMTEVNYSQLFSFNYGEIRITNPEMNESGKKILVLKDSYTNSIIYHIAQHFYETVIYDPRYKEDKIIQDYVEENDFDIVAVLYNSSHIYGKNYNFDTYPVSDE